MWNPGLGNYTGSSVTVLRKFDPEKHTVDVVLGNWTTRTLNGELVCHRIHKNVYTLNERIEHTEIYSLRCQAA
jgi:hypothetical protein